MSRFPDAMESISQVGDGMWLIEQPVLGESNVAFTNCYVLEGSGGDVHVIDPGWDTTASANPSLESPASLSPICTPIISGLLAPSAG
jgi:hypothetical protein